MCTINGCRATFDDKERGSLEEGKIADMVILSADPYTVPRSVIAGLKAEKLILGGQDYQSARRPVIRAMLEGLTSRSKAY